MWMTWIFFQSTVRTVNLMWYECIISDLIWQVWVCVFARLPCDCTSSPLHNLACALVMTPTSEILVKMFENLFALPFLPWDDKSVSTLIKSLISENCNADKFEISWQTVNWAYKETLNTRKNWLPLKAVTPENKVILFHSISISILTIMGN